MLCEKVLPLCLCLCLLHLAGPAARAEDPVPRGRIVERITCRIDSSKSYALYLPSTYTPDRTWPILYCFDPVARGKVPVEQFLEAAERFGWIVVGSHDSRNGLVEDSMRAMAAVWTDTHERFKLDERRIYTTGFSGGARMATWSALACDGCIAGVIACGAGFPTSVQPNDPRLKKAVSFSYFATIGTDDFNFPELKMLEGLLAKAGVTHEVARFEGGHDWAPVPLATRAVGWMEMRAMRAGTRAKDDALVEALYAERIAEARAAETAGRPFDAWLAYAGAAVEFDGLRDVAEVAQHAATLRESKAVRDVLGRENEEVKRQARIAGELAYVANTRPDQEDPLMAKQDFRRRILDVRDAARSKTDSSERRIARRSLHQIFAFYYEGAQNLVIAKKYKQAAEMLEIAVEIASKPFLVSYDLAAARARGGDTKRAIAALRAAADGGFDDAERLRTDPAFDSLRNDPEFIRIQESIRTSTR